MLRGFVDPRNCLICGVAKFSQSSTGQRLPADVADRRPSPKGRPPKAHLMWRLWGPPLPGDGWQPQTPAGQRRKPSALQGPGRGPHIRRRARSWRRWALRARAMDEDSTAGARRRRVQKVASRLTQRPPRRIAREQRSERRAQRAAACLVGDSVALEKRASVADRTFTGIGPAAEKPGGGVRSPVANRRENGAQRVQPLCR